MKQKKVYQGSSDDQYVYFFFHFSTDPGRKNSEVKDEVSLEHHGRTMQTEMMKRLPNIELIEDRMQRTSQLRTSDLDLVATSAFLDKYPCYRRYEMVTIEKTTTILLILSTIFLS